MFAPLLQPGASGQMQDSSALQHDPKTYIDTDPSLANDTLYKYRIQNGNDISNDLVLPAIFAEEATP